MTKQAFWISPKSVKSNECRKNTPGTRVGPGFRNRTKQNKKTAKNTRSIFVFCYKKNFDQQFFSAKNNFDQHFFQPKFVDNIFWGPKKIYKKFLAKEFLLVNFFFTNIFFGQTNFGPGVLACATRGGGRSEAGHCFHLLSFSSSPHLFPPIFWHN